MMFPFIVARSRTVYPNDGTTSTVYILNFWWREWFLDYVRPIKKNDKNFTFEKEIW